MNARLATRNLNRKRRLAKSKSGLSDMWAIHAVNRYFGDVRRVYVPHPGNNLTGAGHWVETN